MSNTIGVLAIGNDGDLTALPGTTKALAAGAAGAAQGRVSPNGQVLGRVGARQQSSGDVRRR